MVCSCQPMVVNLYWLSHTSSAYYQLSLDGGPQLQLQNPALAMHNTQFCCLSCPTGNTVLHVVYVNWIVFLHQFVANLTHVPTAVFQCSLCTCILLASTNCVFVYVPRVPGTACATHFTCSVNLGLPGLPWPWQAIPVETWSWRLWWRCHNKVSHASYFLLGVPCCSAHVVLVALL